MSKSNLTKTMFESIKNSLVEEKNTNSNFKDIIKCTAGNSYVVRFVPNLEDPSKTFSHYKHHGWVSASTGQYISALCPKTWGDPCPVCLERIKLYQKKTEQGKELARELREKENWLVNVYVASDPTSDENEGQVKIFRYGKQIDKIVQEAISGEDADEYGAAIFDLTENGANFRIKVESVAEGSRKWISYNSSKFLNKGAIDNMTPARIKEVHGEIHDLTPPVETKTADELREMVAVHLYGQIESNSSTTETVTDSAPEEVAETTKTETVADTEATTTETVVEDTDTDGIDVDELLKDLG